jgi:hypothetical protein
MPSVLDHKPTWGHLFHSVYAFGTGLQARCGPLALFYICLCSMLSTPDCKPAVCGSLACSVLSAYAFGTGLQARCGSLALFYLSMSSTLNLKPTVGHLFCFICSSILVAMSGNYRFRLLMRPRSMPVQRTVLVVSDLNCVG